MGINQDSLLTERETVSEEENNKGHTPGEAERKRILSAKVEVA